MAKSKFERNKPHVNIGTIGHVDLVIRLELAEILRDRCRQRRLAMVNVADRANVDVRLVALKFALCHGVKFPVINENAPYRRRRFGEAFKGFGRIAQDLIVLRASRPLASGWTTYGKGRIRFQ